MYFLAASLLQSAQYKKERGENENRSVFFTLIAVGDFARKYTFKYFSCVALKKIKYMARMLLGIRFMFLEVAKAGRTKKGGTFSDCDLRFIKRDVDMITKKSFV